ncbi:MAG: type II secretion system F family protein [Azonexus sp.]|jgi:MSHA biogenesis protein MshG|nr:type II secretion system F family protein [Azonexus sp.]
MPDFVWKGRNSAGQPVEGVLEAGNASLAADQLFGTGITPLAISEKPAASGMNMDIQLFKPKIHHTDILLFTRQIHTLIKAGVPILRALVGLRDSSANPAMRDMLQSVRDGLDQGRELSASLARHPEHFTPFYLSMVRVGEMAGQLEQIFLRLFEHMAFERFMREQVKSALRYPAFVIVAIVVAMVIMNAFVIPAFAKVFAGFNAELPLMTRLLIGISDFFVHWWAAMLVGLVAAIVGFRSWIATTAGRYTWDHIKLRIPVAGKIVRKATLARFARSFALAMRSGVPVLQSLSNVALTVDNAWIARRIDDMRTGVERGETVLRAANATGAFTPVVLQMIAVGEESGMLDEMMEEIAAMYQSEVEYELKSLSQQIEPILIVILGVMVLILALGIFLPMWEFGHAALGKKGP